MIPTDFTVASLNTLRLALGQYEGAQVKVMLVYAEHTSDSITELLFYRPYKTIQALKNEAFDEALSVIKNRYESAILSVDFKVFNGFTVSALQLFAEANSIDQIFIPRSYRFEIYKKGFDMTGLIKKSKLPYQEMEWDTSVGLTEINRLVMAGAPK
jgi:hypothetical protein